MKNLLFPVALFLLVGQNTQAQRNVHWIHGLGGDGGSWQPFANDFNNQRQILTNSANTYPTGNGVGGMVQNIQNQLGGGADPTGIAIGHSMGGVATRQIDVQNNGRFGGTITFGSPLRGARVVNNLNNNVAANYINNAIDRLTSGPLAEPILMPLTATVMLGTRLINDFSGARIVQNQRDELDLTPATATDLAEESGYNQGFYGNSTGTPKLVYWGNEASPIHVRLAAGSVGADETAWVNTWNDIRGVYGAFRDINYTLRWTFIFAYPLYNWRGNEWAKGYDYLWDQSENEWSNLIGAGYTYTRSYYTFEFVGTDYNAYQDCINAANGDPVQVTNCENTYFQWVHHSELIYVRDQSDGLVPRRSQIGENTAWTSNAEIRDLPNNSHNEMRRSNESRDELNRAFDGLRSGGSFFIPFR